MGSVTKVTQETSFLTMSDEEYAEEESVSNTSKKGDGTFRKAKGEAKKVELDEQPKEYINEWRKQRQKEEEKMKKLEEAEKKRQEMMKAQKEKMGPASGSKKSKGDAGMGNVADVRREMTKTKEQLEEEKKISLSIRIHPLELDGMDTEALKSKAKELWDQIVKLETERYDLEEKVKRQDYDLKELKERQRQQNKQKAIKLGLDPEALTGKYPPKIRMYSKYERRTDTRTYEDRRKLYEGGWDVLYAELL